jgi:hypothetical protein
MININFRLVKPTICLNNAHGLFLGHQIIEKWHVSVNYCPGKQLLGWYDARAQ